MLTLCSRVACVDAKYYYRMNPDSVTHKPDREWERIYTHEKIISLAEKKFGITSAAYAKARLDYVEELWELLKSRV